MDYGPEETAEQEEDITEPEPEESGPGEPEPEGPEAGSEEPETEEGEAAAEETPEEEPEEEPEETDAEPEEEPEETDAEPEEGPAEETEGQETVSGNELVVGGDVIIFPEDYDLAALGTEPADTASIVQAVERQTDIMTAGFACTCFMLGVLAGALVIAGFRLRRV